MLRKLLSHPPAINALKLLFDAKGPVKADAYTKDVLDLLTETSLAYVEDGFVVISLRGKQFISLFDELRSLMSGDGKSMLRMSFSLTYGEQDVLLLMSREGGELPFEVLLTMAKEKGVVSAKKELLAVVKSLEDIKLLSVEKNLVTVTALGKRTITDALLESFNLR